MAINSVKNGCEHSLGIFGYLYKVAYDISILWCLWVVTTSGYLFLVPHSIVSQDSNQ